MTDDGRLELDDAGQVVDLVGTRPMLVDLADSAAPGSSVATALGSWAGRRAAPWLRARRRAVAAVTVGALALTLGAVWWTSRPAPPPPPPLLTLAQAPVVGADLRDGPVGVGRHLSVAYTLRAAADVARVDVLGLSGPGLTSVGVEHGADAVAGGHDTFVQLGAELDCEDPRIATATTGSYGIVVRTRPSAPGDDRLLVLDPSTSDLATAVRDTCLATVLPSAVAVVSADVTGPAGSSVVDLALTFRNDAAVPLTITTVRAPSTTVETDLSPTVTIAAHGTAKVPTRMLVHDCAGPSQPPALTVLPAPVVRGGAPAAAARAGITVRVGLGDRTTTASYALPWSVPALSRALAALACADPPSVGARLVDVAGSRSVDGSWLVTGRYRLRSSGIGITLGREHFVGDAAPGSSLATTDPRLPGTGWDLAPTHLDGGTGLLPVTFSGTSCEDRDRAVPTSMPVRVTAASRYVYPFELPLDPLTLRRAVDAACAPSALVSVPGWGEVTPEASPVG